MLNKLISLVFLLLFFNVNVVYSETDFLLPQKKPSIFKKIDKNFSPSSSGNLPQKKPLINQGQDQKEEVVVKKEEKKEIKKIKTIE